LTTGLSPECLRIEHVMRGKGRLGELWKVVRIPAGIDEPELSRGAAELKAITRPVSLDLDAEARIPIPLGDGVTDVLGPANHVHDRYLGGIDRLPEVKCERGIVAQLLSRSHQRDEFAERDAVIRVPHVRASDPRAICQRLSVGPLLTRPVPSRPRTALAAIVRSRIASAPP